ncbi:hypothetical protein M9458_001912, partial [Cirrhinus mrigala]
MCVVKVTRVENDLLAHSTKQVTDASSEQLSTPPLSPTTRGSAPDPGHSSSETSLIFDEGRVSTNTNSTAQPGPEPTSESSVTANVTLGSERTAESPNQTLNCESVSETSAPSIPVTHSPRLNSTGAAVLFSETDSQQAKIETEEMVADILTESSIDCGTSALYKEQSLIRLDSALQGSQTSENRTNSEMQTTPFCEMPLLMPELIEERANPQSLAPEMPSLTLAVRPDTTRPHSPNNNAPVLHLEKLHSPPVITDDVGTCSERPCPDWPFVAPQEGVSQSQNSISDTFIAKPASPSLVPQWRPPEESRQEGHEHTNPSTDQNTQNESISHFKITTHNILQCSTVADLMDTRDSEMDSVEREDKQTSLCLGEHSSSLTSSQGSFVESKPFTIWKNLSSQNPAVLIESLQPELVVGLTTGVSSLTDYAHESLSYTMWSESGCQPEKFPDSPNSSPCTQTWTNLEPIPMQCSDADMAPNAPPDLKQENVELEPAEACVLSQQAGSQEPQEGEFKAQEYYAGANDSDSCESGDKVADSSSESSEENAMSDPEYVETGLEPGE